MLHSHPSTRKLSQLTCLLVVLQLLSVGGTLQAGSQKTPGNQAGIPNFLRFSDRIFSGAEPRSEDDFRFLQQKGIRTIVSVDSVRPRVELAEQFGMRYVHAPLGYDGISPESGLTITSVVRSTSGPVFVHCHHGKHRGPAAAAIACRVEGSASEARCLRLLETAGTSRDYAGLWRDVAKFRVPPAGQKLPELKSSVDTEPLADAMGRLSRRMDQLTSATADSRHQHALLVYETLKECNRTGQTGYGKSFRKRMLESEKVAARLLSSAKHSRSDFEALLACLKNSCVTCHRESRD